MYHIGAHSKVTVCLRAKFRHVLTDHLTVLQLIFLVTPLNAANSCWLLHYSTGQVTC